jgi:hypothetical protein
MEIEGTCENKLRSLPDANEDTKESRDIRTQNLPYQCPNR